MTTLTRQRVVRLSARVRNKHLTCQTCHAAGQRLFGSRRRHNPGRSRLSVTPSGVNAARMTGSRLVGTERDADSQGSGDQSLPQGNPLQPPNRKATPTTDTDLLRRLRCLSGRPPGSQPRAVHLLLRRHAAQRVSSY